MDRPGAVSNGSRLFYAAEAKTRSACRALSFGFDSRGEPTSVCSQGGGGILAEAGLGLAGVHEGSASWVKVNREIEKELREIGRLRCEPLPGGGRK